MSDEQFRRLIEQGDVEGVRRALQLDAAFANRTIRWHLNQDNESDPLHYVSDCVFNGWLSNGREGEIAEMLLTHGAAINGTQGRESPLIGSASLGAEKVSTALMKPVLTWRLRLSTRRVRSTGQHGSAPPESSSSSLRAALKWK